MKKPTIDQMSAELRAKNKAKFLEGSAEKRRMYHATHEDFNAFRNNFRGVHFLTPDPKFADDHLTNSEQDDHQEGANIMPVHVHTKNPFDYENKKHVNSLGVKASIGKIGLDQIRKGDWSRIEDRTTLKAIKDLGHDGVYVNEGGVKNLGVFHPHQIKSATGNRGTYDINDPDITKAKGGIIHKAEGGAASKATTMGINVASDRKAGMRYADLIVDGHKTHESRNSDSLRPYVGKRVSIVRTGEGAAKAIGEVTVGEPLIVSKKKFRSMEPQHLVPEGSAFDIKTETKHLYPMHDPVRYDEERDVGHGIIARKVIHKADGGTIQGNQMDTPTLAQMRVQLNQRKNPDYIDSIGIDQAVDMNPKKYISPNQSTNEFMPVGGAADQNGLPVGGIDQNNVQPGKQLMTQQPDPMGQQQQADLSNQTGFEPDGGSPQGPQQPMGNMLSMTPQGQALQAMAPAQGKPMGMANGGNVALMRAKMMMQSSPKQYAKGGEVDSPSYKPTENPKRILFHGKGHGQTKGIVVPRHMWEGSEGKRKVDGMKEINKARAEVYGDEKRDPLNVGQVGRVHKKVLDEHFAKPLHEQLDAETEAISRLRKAKHIGHGSNTLDESEKLDTVRHERDDKGRAYVGFASKGVAGHSLYTSGHGKDSEHHILNTCPGQTTGCGGGHDKNGVVDSSKGTCFAPNAESQYVNAAIRRACHEQAKHDPKMTRDWILAHTGSLRHVSSNADKKNLVTLFRPNVVDETDVSSRHVIKGLNKQRKAEGKPNIVANSYGKTNELHDPENGYHVTHSNVGPKTKHGAIIADNVDRDKQRVRSTIHAADASGKDFVNDDGNKTPPKGSYMVTNVKRNSPMSKEMEKHITHAKYWSQGRHEGELSKEEKEEGEEGHFGANGKPTSPEKAHYGHTTHKGLRYDYQKQHILHPRLVQVGKNDDGSPHMIPTDSRFKDEEFLPKDRFKTKNGKNAGAILMTTPTESTSNHLHHSSFTHDVNKEHIEHAKKNKGEYEIDSPIAQAKAQGKEYVPPQPINIVKKASGGSIRGMNKQYDDDFNAFPEQNFMAQHHHANRVGVEDISEVHPSLLKRQED